MKIVRLYSGTDHESHFEDFDIELTPAGRVRSSELQTTAGMVFRSASLDHRSDFHPMPPRQLVVTLSGRVEIETGNGSVRRFGPGDVMLAEDTSGSGHLTRAVGGQSRDCVFIALE